MNHWNPFHLISFIFFSGGWGYAPKFRKLKQDLESRFPGQVEVTGEAVPGSTGQLEVQIVGGKMLHSKLGGDGYVDTDAKLNAIFAGVEEALAAWATPMRNCGHCLKQNRVKIGTFNFPFCLACHFESLFKIPLIFFFFELFSFNNGALIC